MFGLKQAWACVFGGAMLAVIFAAHLWFFIWLAENIATWSNAWLYPSQLGGWHLVSPAKLASWFLLMIISVVLVTWISPPQPPDDEQPPTVRPDAAIRRRRPPVR